jgi:hypothetical protein
VGHRRIPMPLPLSHEETAELLASDAVARLAAVASV